MLPIISKLNTKTMTRLIDTTNFFTQTEYLLRFDGCSKGNPGPSGAGAVIYYNDQEIWSDSKYLGIQTNNYAEYSGLIIGLQKALDMNIVNLKIEGDSNLVIKQMKGEYKVNSPNIIPLYNQASELKNRFNIIDFKHIYREYNTRADELSNDGLRKR
jgi:ribonuclease HI